MREGRHLCALVHGDVVAVPGNPHVPIPDGVRKRVQQQRSGAGKGPPAPHLRARVQAEVPVANRTDGDGLALRRHDIVEVRIRQFGEDEVVHLVERVRGEWDVTTPFQVVEDIRLHRVTRG